MVEKGERLKVIKSESAVRETEGKEKRERGRG